MKPSYCCTILLLLVPLGGWSQAPELAVDSADSNCRSSIAVDRRGPGVKALLSGNIEKAIKLARRHQAINPLSAHHTLCAAYITQGDWASAEAACDRAIELAENSDSALGAFGDSNHDRVTKAYANRAALDRMLSVRSTSTMDLSEHSNSGQKACAGQMLSQERHQDLPQRSAALNK